MKRVQTEWMLLIGSLVAFGGVGVSIGLMTLDSYIPGGVFWGCLLIGIVLQVILSVRCHRLRIKAEIASKQWIGLLAFCKNTYGMLADAMMVIALIAFVLSMIFRAALQLQMIWLALLIFGFCAHCVCNGKNMELLMHVARRGKRYRNANRTNTRGGMEE